MVDRWIEVARLVERARSGDGEAFRSLLEMHHSAVTSTLFACGVRCPETARDLTQEVAIRAWSKLESLKKPRTFSSWLRQIAANAARDQLRRSAVRREDELEEAIHVESGDNPHLRAERVAELRFMLAALGTEDPEVVSLLVARADGLSAEELARRAGLSVGALKMRLMRARKRLRSRLEALRRGD